MEPREYYQKLFRKKLKIIIPLIFFESLSLLGIVFSILGVLPRGYLISSIAVCGVSFLCLVYILISALKEFYLFIRLNPPENR